MRRCPSIVKNRKCVPRTLQGFRTANKILTVWPCGNAISSVKNKHIHEAHVVDSQRAIGPDVEGLRSQHGSMQSTILRHMILALAIADNVCSMPIASRLYVPSMAMAELPSRLKGTHQGAMSKDGCFACVRERSETKKKQNKRTIPSQVKGLFDSSQVSQGCASNNLVNGSSNVIVEKE